MSAIKDITLTPSVYLTIPIPQVIDWIVKFDPDSKDIIDCLYNGPIKSRYSPFTRI